ncbi:MAG: hypothetical protein FJW34_16910 [Acidobacteria bacterium]|nr:hypothetical protein [Acidobacteriota bacterium]
MRRSTARTLVVSWLLGGGAGGAVLCAAARITLADGHFVLGDARFVVRGVAYSNAAIGESAGYNLAASSCRYARDLPLMAALGANTVRTYALLHENARPFLELLETTGLYWLAGFPLEPFHDPGQPLEARKRHILDAFGEYARRFHGQRRLLGYVFGSEVTRDYNAKFAGSPSDFYALLAEAAALLRQIEPQDTPLLTTAVRDAAELALSPEGLSFWSWNANPGRSFGGLLEQARRAAGKPVLIAEFGVDAFDERTRQEDERAQAEAAAGLWGEITATNWLLGGIYSSFLDEWWRGGPDARFHGGGGSPQPGYPDGFRNDGWSGIFRVTATGQPGADSLGARSVAGVLTRLWGGPGLSAPVETGRPRLARVENAASGLEMASPGALVRVTGDRLARVTAADPRWPFYLGQTCLCFSAAAARLGMLASAELSAQVPPELPPGETTVVLYRAGVAGEFLRVRLSQNAPGIFPGGLVWAGSQCRASHQNGVRPGDWLEVYTTGLSADAQVTADFAGLPASVAYFGPLAGAVGIQQVNLQIPPEMERTLGSGLRLLAAGAGSNLYPLSVVGPSDPPAIVLRPTPPEVVLQAGGEPATVAVEVEGVNAFCGAVFFRATRAPEGISFEIPVAFPGQKVSLTLRAAPGTPALPGSTLELTGYSGGASGQATLRLLVLPNQGDIAVRAVSGGFKADPLARFDWNWHPIFTTRGGGPGRGLNVLSVNPWSGVFSAVRNFDTWADEGASAALIDHLTRLPAGTIVLMAVADEATYRLAAEARGAIATWFGSEYIRALGYQDSWALIGRKGALKPLAEGVSPDRQVFLERILTLPQP